MSAQVHMIHRKFGPSTDLWVCEHGTAYPDRCEECMRDNSVIDIDMRLTKEQDAFVLARETAKDIGAMAETKRRIELALIDFYRRGAKDGAK